MTVQRLPTDVVALLQHVELRQIGWHNELFQLLTIGVLAAKGASSSVTEVKEALRQGYGLPITDAEFASTLKKLEATERVTRTSGDLISLADEARTYWQIANEESTRQEAEAAAAFELHFPDICRSHAAPHWEHFRDHLLLPLVAQAGARLSEVLTPSPDGQLQFSLTEYCNGYPAELHDLLTAHAKALLSESPKALGAFMLSLLHSQLLMEAGRMSPEHVTLMSDRLKGQIEFALFLDTNVIFSLIGIHSNPADEAVRELHALVSRLGNNVRIRFYVTPDTLLECRETVDAIERRLRGHTFSPIVGRAARSAPGLEGTDSVALRMMEVAVESNRTVNATAFLAPFRRDLLPALRAYGVELYNEDFSSFRTSPAFIEDVENQLSYEIRTYGDNGKGRKALEHDVLLWHIVSQKRALVVSSPLDAKWWCLTVDYHFMGFDAHKQRGDRDPTPECISPSTLIQLLQLWQPRSSDGERALLASLRAMIPQFEGVAASEATARILDVLWRYEVDQMGVDGVAAILASDALRTSIAAESDEQRQVELVRLEIDKHMVELRKELAVAEQRLVELTAEVDHLRESEQSAYGRIGELEAEAGKALSEVDNLKQQLRGSQRSADEIKQAQQNTIREVTGELAIVRSRTALLARLSFALTQLVGVPVLSLGILTAINATPIWTLGWYRGMAILAASWLCVLFVWSWAQSWLWKTHPEVTSWSLFRLVVWMKKPMRVGASAICSALFGELVIRIVFS